MVKILPWTGLCVAAAATLALPANARTATARIVACGAQDCILVHGHRSSSQAVILVNEREVAATGRNHWQARLPVATVKDWSAPFARTLRVSVVNPAGSVERSEAVRLPVGLLGQNVELASLVVHAR
jgi:hypothetical protein